MKRERSAAPGDAARYGPVPEWFSVDADGLPMSGLIAQVENPRGVILALHGGAARPEYYDAAAHPEHSLVRLGAQLGYTTIAPFRPGYAFDTDLMTHQLSAEQQVAACFALIGELVGDDLGGGVFVVGHSQGCILAVRMAASEHGRTLVGIEISGTGVSHQRQTAGTPTDGAQRRRQIHELLWTPEELYLPGIRVFSRTPAFEGVDARGWPDEFPRLATKVTVPVRITVAEHEKWWRGGQEALSEIAGLFTGAPRLVTSLEEASGHNISVGVTARAYHLKVIAFIEECLAAQLR